MEIHYIYETNHTKIDIMEKQITKRSAIKIATNITVENASYEMFIQSKNQQRKDVIDSNLIDPRRSSLF